MSSTTVTTGWEPDVKLADCRPQSFFPHHPTPTDCRYYGNWRYSEPGNGKALGLDYKFAYNIVKQLGNYGEMFNRNGGQNSPLKLDRGPNRLFTDGGLMFPMAFQ